MPPTIPQRGGPGVGKGRAVPINRTGVGGKSLGGSKMQFGGKRHR